MFYFIVYHLILNSIIVPVVQDSSDTNFRGAGGAGEEEEVEYYTNTWLVCIKGGLNEAERTATQSGFDSRVEVSGGLPDFYLFRNSNLPIKMEQPDEHLTRKLREKSEIKWVEQQKALKLIPTIRLPGISFAKKIIQSILQNCRVKNDDELPRDLSIAPVWTKYRLFGKNVKVIVIDDGVETNHSDLVDNYDPELGLDLQNNDNTPDPEHFQWHTFSHGTRCAGVIGMKANNSICGVGIAPSVTLGAVRLLGPKMLSEFDMGKALIFKFNEVDIMSNSWTMRDTGKSVWFDGLYSLSVMKVGITKGRGGKGLIYVFACGSRKSEGENCGRDALRNCIYTISVASCDHHGKTTLFSERCASIMVTTYSGTGYKGDSNVVATDTGNSCTINHSGTSASAPIVSGAVALALEANPNLTWRDVQHLLAWTSQMAPLQNNPPGTWIKNGAGFYVSHDFGFGMLNISELVEMAMGFQNVPPLNVCVTKAKLWKKNQQFHIGLKVKVMSDGCKGLPTEVAYLEHAQVTLSLTYPKRGDLQIELTSPSGTKATLLEPRSFDTYRYGIPSWTFESIMTWGENPQGMWTVSIIGKDQKSFIANIAKTIWSTLKNATSSIMSTATNDEGIGNQNSVDTNYPGELKELYLIFHGTKLKPQHYGTGPRLYHNLTLLS